MHTKDEENIAFYEFKKILHKDLSRESEKAQNDIQNSLDDILDEYYDMFVELKAEELLGYMIDAYNNWFFLDSFSDIAKKVLETEKHFDMPKQVFELIAVMNELSKNETMQLIVENFVKTIDSEKIQCFASDSYRDGLNIEFLTSFAKNYAWGLKLEEKAFLWDIAISTVNSEFTQWLNDNNVVYDRCFDNDKGFNVLVYYNLDTEDMIKLSSIMYKKELEYRKNNDLDTSFHDTLIKAIEEGNDSFVKFLVSEGYDLSKPSFDYYNQVINNHIAQNEIEKGHTQIKNFIIEKEQNYLNDKMPLVETKRKQIKV